MKRYLKKISSGAVFGLLLAFSVFLVSCEQTNYQPNMSAAPGGGTVTTYKAYTLTSADSTNIYGRVVFYKYSSSVTMVQMGLYNGKDGNTYESSIFPGKVGDVSATPLKKLDIVSGETGEFATSKFFMINEAGFYDKLDTYNANVAVMAGTAIVASGNIGANAAPVVQAE